MAHINTGIDSIVHILYHYPCPDGAFAALAAYLRFRNRVKELVFVPHSVYTAIDVQTISPKSHAYLLDYIGKEDFPFKLAKQATTVTVIDHHKTSMESLSKHTLLPNMEINIVNDKSGATLALNHFMKEVDLFNGDLKLQEHMQRIFSYIEDNDLWKHRLPHSQKFSQGLHSLKIDFDVNKNPDLFDKLMALDVDDLIQKGKSMKGENDAIIESEVSKSFVISLGGSRDGFGKCLAIISSYSELRSVLGHHLAEKSGSLGYRTMACVVYEVTERPGEYKVSLRSIGEDTTEISTKYGGGGHMQASSFFVPKSIFEEWKEK